MSHWPQIAFFAYAFLDVVGTAILFGAQRPIRPRPLWTIFEWAGCAIVLGFGGFFSAWGWKP